MKFVLLHGSRRCVEEVDGNVETFETQRKANTTSTTQDLKVAIHAVKAALKTVQEWLAFDVADDHLISTRSSTSK